MLADLRKRATVLADGEPVTETELVKLGLALVNELSDSDLTNLVSGKLQQSLASTRQANQKVAKALATLSAANRSTHDGR